jgi:hypothetical protein
MEKVWPVALVAGPAEKNLPPEFVMWRSLRKLVNTINPSKKAGVARRCEQRMALQVESLERRDLMSIVGPTIAVPGTVIGNPITGQPVNPPNVAGPLIDPIQREYALTASETDCNGTSVQKILGTPTSPETPISVPNVAVASMQTYQGGTIYFSPDSGAHVVYGDIATKYANMGGPTGYGLPTSDEADLSGVPGVRFTSFLGNNRAICWSPNYGPHAIYGCIGAEYTATASETDCGGTSVQKILGKLTSDEEYVSGLPGFNRMNSFEGGTIYYSTASGAHVVYGDIASKYYNIGGPTGFGLPSCDEQWINGGRITTFQKGDIVETVSTGLLAQPYPKAAAAYSPVSGSLYNGNGGGPSYKDVQQGSESDCWLLASLAAETAQNSTAITNMITHLGTIDENGVSVEVASVRFFDSSGNPHSVIVDSNLPSGGFRYDQPVGGVSGSVNVNNAPVPVLWAALVEKAYAEADGRGYVTGSQNNTNDYDSLGNLPLDASGNAPGGQANWALQAITGKSVSSGSFTSTTDIATAWLNKQPIVLGTPQSTSVLTVNGTTVASFHAYAVVAYDASTKQFTLFNPWGVNGKNETIKGKGTYFCPGTVSGTVQQLAAAFTGMNVGSGVTASEPQSQQDTDSIFSGLIAANGAALHISTMPAPVVASTHQSHDGLDPQLVLDLVFAQADTLRHQGKEVNPFDLKWNNPLES